MTDDTEDAQGPETAERRRRQELARRRLDAVTEHAWHEPRSAADYEREVPPHHG